LTPEDALRIIVERARLMAEEAPAGTMAAVMGLSPDAIAAALPEGAEVANYNGPQQTIIAGPEAALAAAETALKEAGAKRVIRLNVSGPFHSAAMRRPAELFIEFLKDIPFGVPVCAFVSSVTAQVETDPERIRTLLGEQLYSPVRWTETQQAIGEIAALELGPGNVLQGIAKRTPGAPTITPVGTFEQATAYIQSTATETP
jgi:[acyl-carrier-protein] S-malonyltransferase